MSQDEILYALKDWPQKGSSVEVTPQAIVIGNRGIGLGSISAVDLHDAFFMPEWKRRFNIYEKWVLAAVFVCFLYGLTQFEDSLHEGASFAKFSRTVLGSLLYACLFTFPITRGIWWLVNNIFLYEKLRKDRLVLRIYMGRERVEVGPGEDSSQVRELERAVLRALSEHQRRVEETSKRG